MRTRRGNLLIVVGLIALQAGCRVPLLAGETSCASPGECAPGQGCRDGICQACLADGECAGALVCDLSSGPGRCLTSCGEDAHCQPQAYCTAEGACAERLADGSGGCARDRMCQSGHCVDTTCSTCGDATADADEECDRGTALNGQLCAPPTGGTCQYCTTDCRWATRSDSERTRIRLDGGLVSGTSTYDGKVFVPLVPFTSDGEARDSTVAGVDILGTQFDGLYQSETWIATSPTTFTITLPDGEYSIHLHFCDWLAQSVVNPGDRLFHVDLQGTRVLTDLDILAEAGKYTALVKSFPVTVDDGTLTVTITNHVFFAEIGAIEILPLGEPPLATEPATDCGPDDGTCPPACGYPDDPDCLPVCAAEPVTSSCACGSTVVDSGYCCDEAPQSDPCSQPSNPYEGLNALYVNPLTGNDSNEGNTPAFAIASLERAAEMAPSFDVIALVDTTHRGTLALENWAGTSSNPKVIGTYWEYGNERATIAGYKELGAFTNAGGNVWSITDEGLPDKLWGSVSNEYFSVLLAYNYLLRSDGAHFAMSRYPQTGFLNTTDASTADPATFIENTDSPFPDGHWTGSYVNFVTSQWVLARARNTYSSNRHAFTHRSGNMGNIVGEGRNTAESINYYISNHVNAFVNDGDWAYDYSTKTLRIRSATDPNVYTWSFATTDHVLTLHTCDYVRVENLRLTGGIESTVDVVDGSSVTFDGCELQYTPAVGLDVYSVNGLIVKDSRFYDAAGSGIYSMRNENEIYENNVFLRIGDDYSMMVDISQMNSGLHVRGRNGTLDIRDNYVDTVGYSGICINTTVAYETPDDMRVERNVVLNTMRKIGDGGAFYHGEYSGGSARTGVVRNNLFMNVGTPEASTFCRGGNTYNGIYLDSDSSHITVENNLVMNTAYGLFINGGTYNTITGNTFYNSTFVKPTTSTAEMYLSLMAWGPGTYNTITNNTAISKAAVDTGFRLKWNGTNEAAGTLVDGNKYFHPFRDGNDILSTSVYPGPGIVRKTLAEFETDFGWEANGTFNTPDWTYQDVTGISEDEFVWLFFNGSSADHTFSLGAASFKDLSGDTVSGGITVGPFDHKVLFYASGDLGAVDDPVFAPE